MSVSKIKISQKGPEFSRLVWGLWRLADWKTDRNQLQNLISFCIDNGITTFDHADIYGRYTCEEIFGSALGEMKIDRSKLQIVTKCGIKFNAPNRPDFKIKSYDTGKDHIVWSATNSIQMLKCDYLDLLLIHRPDPFMNADETADGIKELRKSGKVLHFGVSNFNPSQFELLQSRLDFPLITNQIEFSVSNIAPLYDGTLDQCQKLRISPMAWSPLGGGNLFKDQSEKSVRLRNTLTEIGNELGGLQIDQIALAWLMTHPSNVIPVLGTGNSDRIKSALAADKIKLSRDQWFSILKASNGNDVP